MFVFVLKIEAQVPIGNQEPEVKVIARAVKDAIKLRWGVTTPTTWNYSNIYGFTIERKTITRDGKILIQPEVKSLVSHPIKPKPMHEWETLTENNVNAAVAAQAIYGEDFNVNMQNEENDILSIINQATALEQRFSFALFAADQDFEVAKFSGLGYVDTLVVKGEQYLYTIKSEIPKERLLVKSGGAYIGPDDFKALPEPLDFVGVFSDKSVTLSWNYVLLKKYYNNYIVERSEDHGITFKALNNIPVTNLGDREKQSSDRMFYADNLLQNNKEYQYRIRGISPFGEIGPPSAVSKGKGVKALIYNPGIVEAELTEDESTVKLTWDFPEEGQDALAYFQISRSSTLKGTYKVIVNTIAKTTKTFEINNLEPINYFIITAVGLDGTKRTSFSKMVQLKDIEPPEIPSELFGTIDSLGIVRLQWKKNTENDFLGYRVFRANLKEDEFTQVTFEPIPDSEFVDTIKLKTLNEKVYYKVQAFDKRYNPSEFSEILKLKKPDVIPPTQPVFKKYTTDKGRVRLEWIPSSSEDAVQTLIYRKEKGIETAWTLVKAIPISNSDYEDIPSILGTTYLYTLITLDNSGLESKPIAPLSVTVASKSAPELNKLTAFVNVETRSIRVVWKYSPLKVEEYALYRAKEDEKLTLYKILDGDIHEFIDMQLQINTQYTYGVQALMDNGNKSPLKIIKIEF